MAVTQEELDSFHRFAQQHLQNGGAELSIEELIWLWRDANRDDVHAAIRQGLADVDAGRTQPFREASDEFRRRNNLPPCSQ